MIFSDLRAGTYEFSIKKPDEVRPMYDGELITDRTFRPGCGWVVTNITKSSFTLEWTMSNTSWHLSLTDFALMFPNSKREDELV